MNPPNTKLIPWFVMLVIVLSIVTAMQPVNATNLNSRWEYTYVYKWQPMLDHNKLGQEGWEMSGTCENFVYFKRKI